MRTTEAYEQSYSGNNSTSTPYPITFPFTSGENLEITTKTSAGVETILTASQYTITRDEVTELGSFTTASAVPTSSTVKVARKNLLTQDTDYVHADTFPSATHEYNLDRIVEMIQYVRSIAQRSLRVSPANGVISNAAPRTNTLAGLDSGGNTRFMTSEEVIAFLNLSGGSGGGGFSNKTWANDGERATVVPDFLGQLGTQRNTGAIYVSNGTAAGNWVATTVSGGVADGAVTTTKLATGALSADTTGRTKMADAFLTAAKLQLTLISGLAASTLLGETDVLFGSDASGTVFHKFPGDVLRPSGSIIGVVGATPYTASTDITTVVPNDGTIPQITEGTQILTVTITPKFSTSFIRVFSTGCGATSSSLVQAYNASLFRSPTSNALQTCESQGNTWLSPYVLDYIDTAGTTSPITYTVRVGVPSAATLRMNGYTSSSAYGAAMQCTLVATEIKF